MRYTVKLFPDLSEPIHFQRSPDGLWLPNGSTLHWPEPETGVVLRYAKDGELLGEWWPGDLGYDDVLQLFDRFPRCPEIDLGPTLRVIWPED